LVRERTNSAKLGVHRHLRVDFDFHGHRHVPARAILEFLLAVGSMAGDAGEVLKTGVMECWMNGVLDLWIVDASAIH
jgi:hypothetical protein